MIDSVIIEYVWNTISSGMAYDSLKYIFGNGYEKIETYVNNDEKEKFEIALESILTTNKEIMDSIKQLKSGMPNQVSEQNHYGSGDNIGRDKVVNNINPDSLSLAIEDAMLALRQMPGRLQEAANSGKTNFRFNEAREKIEKLSSLSKATNRNDISNLLLEFETKYNNWLEIINKAINGDATIGDINKFHQNKILNWFTQTIYLPNKTEG